MKLVNYFKIYPTKNDFKYILFKFLLFYFILLIILFIFQRKIMYFPNTDTSINEHWIPLINNNKTIALQEKDNLNSLYHVILFHGNAGNANMKNYYKLVFPNANIIVAEYPGFGFRAKESLNKDNILIAASEIVETVHKDNKPIILLGESLGSGIASEMAIKYNIKDLVLATPYTTISDVAQDKLPIFPVHFLLKDDFNNIDTLKNFTGNLTILIAEKIAEKDQVIPTVFAYNLSHSINKNINKLEILIKDSTHNSWAKNSS